MVITRNSIHVQRHAILFAYFRKEPFKNAFLLKALVNISSLKKSASWKFQNINSQLSRNVIIENFIKFQTLFISFDNFFLLQILKRYKKFKTKILFLLINDILPTFESPKAHEASFWILACIGVKVLTETAWCHRYARATLHA